MLQSPDRPITLTFCDSPDVEITFNNFMDVKLTPFDKFLVVTGFFKHPGPLQLSGQLKEGDVVVSCNGTTFPTNNVSYYFVVLVFLIAFNIIAIHLLIHSLQKFRDCVKMLLQ